MFSLDIYMISISRTFIESSHSALAENIVFLAEIRSLLNKPALSGSFVTTDDVLFAAGITYIMQRGARAARLKL